MKHILPGVVLVLACARSALAVDLATAFDAAVAKDPGYAAAAAALAAGQARARQGEALWRPNLNLGAGLGYGDQRSSTTGAQFAAPRFGSSQDVAFRTDIDGGSQTRWRVNLSQPLIDGERAAAARQLEHGAELAQARYRDATQALALRLAQTLVDLLSARDALARMQTEAGAAREAQAAAQAHYDEGQAPITALLEAQAQADAIEAELIGAQDALTLAETAWLDLTGLPAQQAQAPCALQGEPGRAAGCEPAALLAGSLADWLARAERDNPLLQMQRLGQEIARAEVDKYRARSAPTLALVAQAGDERASGDGEYGATRVRGASRSIGLQLNIPLYTGGLRSARHDEAAALAEQSRLEGQALVLEVQRHARAAWLAVASSEARLRAAEQARRSAGERLEATRLGLEVGERVMPDLLAARAGFEAAEQALRQARYARLLAQLRLLAAAGALDRAALAAVER